MDSVWVGDSVELVHSAAITLQQRLSALGAGEDLQVKRLLMTTLDLVDEAVDGLSTAVSLRRKS